jgi:hypothetical protein
MARLADGKKGTILSRETLTLYDANIGFRSKYWCAKPRQVRTRQFAHI